MCRDQSASLAVVTISDAGAAFDPLAASPKPRPGTLAEAESGGLGLLVIHRFFDNLNYRYSEGRNQLAFSQRWIGVRQWIMPIQYGNKESLQYGVSDAARSKERREVLEGRLLRITQDFGLLINAPWIYSMQ